MRQELIEKAVHLLETGEYLGKGWIGANLTEQEYQYACGVIDDRLDDSFDEAMGKEGSAARLERRRGAGAAVPMV